MHKKTMLQSLMGLIVVIIFAGAVPSAFAAGCASCQGIAGLGVEIRDGSTWALPVASGWDLGPGGPGISSPTRLPIPGGPRNFGTANNPSIRMGRASATLEDGSIHIEGVQRALWSWTTSQGAGTLIAPGGYHYAFNASGLATSISGPDGLRVTSYEYDPSHSDRITSVTDSYGNEWTYEFSTADHAYAPTAVENPGHTKRVEFSYKTGLANGNGQYDVVTIKKWNGSAWVEERHTDYSYDPDNRITLISSSVPNGQTSTTHIEYVDGTEGGQTDPVRRICNPKLQIDIIYEYREAIIAEAYGGNKTYGVTRVRQRANCASSDQSYETYDSSDNSNTTDMVTDYYYYRDTDAGKNTYPYKTVRLQSDGQGGLDDYSTVKYQRYGYLDRFPSGGGLPANYAAEVLRGQIWKQIDARNKTKKLDYSTENGMVTKVTLPSFDEINYSYLQDGTNDTEFIRQIIDARGAYTRYTRDQNHPSLVTKVEVSNNGANWSTVKEMSYYDDTVPERAYLLHTVTVPDIGDGSDDMVTTYDYADPEGGYRPQPTEEDYEWYNFNAGTPGYEPAHSHTSFYADGRIRWDKDALDHQTDYDYDNESRLVRTLSPVDQEDIGTVDTATSTTITDNGKTWYTDQLEGMILTIESGDSAGDYVITGNSEDTITVAISSGGTGSATGSGYQVRPVSTRTYSECCGQVEEETDGAGRKTYYQYNDQGRVWKVRNSETGNDTNDPPLVEYTYNDLGQKTVVRTYKDSSDNTGRATSYTYDQLGRVKQVDYPTNGGTVLLWSEYYQYDEADNLVAKLIGTVSAGNVTTGSITAYQYDSNGRLAYVQHNYPSLVWPVTSGVDSYGDISVDPDVWYSFDGGSNLKDTMHDVTGTSYYGYDASGRLNYYKPGGDEYEVYYTYNAAGEKLSIIITEYDGGIDEWLNKYKTAYTYFKNGWLKQVKGQKYVSGNWTDVTQVDFEYAAAGSVIKRRNNKDAQTPDIVTEYAYNARNQALMIDHKLSGTSRYALDYLRDGVGAPLQVTFGGNSFQNAYTNGNIVRYGYDLAGRLTSQTWGHDSGGWQQDHADTWNYDWVGNRDPGSNNYNQVDELNGYQYDMLGNVEYDPSSGATERTRYHYNDDNLLRQVEYVNGGTTTTTTMTWDANQQRTKVESASGTWKMVYDATAGVPAVLLTGTEYYVRMPGGELLTSFTDGQTPTSHYHHFDNLGSTVLLTDGSGNVSASKTYDAWGTTLAGTGGAMPYEYVGELGYYTHCSTQGTAVDDLLQLGVRFYDPQIGRFTQRDPLSTEPAYCYAYDAPSFVVDADGAAATAYGATLPVWPPTPGLPNPPWNRKNDQCNPNGNCWNCSGCEEDLGEYCKFLCTIHYAKQASQIPACVAGCVGCLDAAGIKNCGAGPDDEQGFLKDAYKCLDKALGKGLPRPPYMPKPKPPRKPPWWWPF